MSQRRVGVRSQGDRAAALEGTTWKRPLRAALAFVKALFLVFFAAGALVVGGTSCGVVDPPEDLAHLPGIPGGPPVPGGDGLPPFPPHSIVPSDPVGYLPGSGSVTPFGEATYTIPIDVPAGRGGVDPQLSLTYGSRAGSGILGVGWALSGISEITRCAKTITSGGVTTGILVGRTDVDDFCLDGQRMVKVGATIQGNDADIEFRTERDTFAKIYTVGFPERRFRVLDRSGLTLDYAPVKAPEIKVDDDGTTLSSLGLVSDLWVVTDVTDRSGSTAHYDYEIDPGGAEARVRSIDYAGSTITNEPPRRRILFHYEDRVDQALLWTRGVLTTRTKRLSSIEMLAPDPYLTKRVWYYTFTYQPSAVTKRDLLASVHRCDASGVCLWGKTFTWSAATAPVVAHDLPTGEGFTPFSHPDPFLVLDVDGDGKHDLLYQNTSPFYQGRVTLRTADGSGTPLMAAHDETAVFGDGLGPFFRLGMSRAADVDGDGRAEVYAAQEKRLWGTQDKCFWFGYQLYRWNLGSKKFDASGPFHGKFSSHHLGCPAGFDPGQAFPLSTFVDADGDGLLDLLDTPDRTEQKDAADDGDWVGFGQYQLRMNLGGGTFGAPMATGVAPEASPGLQYAAAVELQGDGRGDVLIGDLGRRAVTLVSDNTAPILSGTSSLRVVDLVGSPGLPIPVVFADLNGDGLKDALYPPDADTPPDPTPVVRWNTGNGYLPPQPLVGAPLWLMPASNGTEPYPVPKAVDLDGDGRDDLVVENQIYLSRGDGSFDHHILPVDTGWADVQLGDFNGDGSSDIVGIVDDHLRWVELPWRKDHDLLLYIADEGALDARDSFLYSRSWSFDHTPPPAVTCTFPQRCIRTGFPVVVEHATTSGATSDGKARYHKWDYSYLDPRSDLHGRGFLGFAEVHVFDRTLNSETITTYDNQTTASYTRPYDGAPVTIYPNLGLPMKVVSIDPVYPSLESETWPSALQQLQALGRVKETVYTYQWENLGGSYYVHPQAFTSRESEQKVLVDYDKVTLPYDPAAKVLRRRSGHSEYDAYGNLLHEVASTLGGVTTTIENRYDNHPDTWLIGLLTSHRESSYTPSSGPPREPSPCGLARGGVPTPREVSYTYDALGRLYTRTVEPNGGDPALTSTTTFDRGDPRGVVTRITSTAAGVAPRAVSLIYDGEGLYPQRAVNDLGHTSTRLHHPALGVVVLSQDSNGVETLTQYDGFGRPKQVLPPDGNAASLSYEAYQITPGQIAGITTSLARLDGQGARSTKDDLGRSMVEAVLGFDGQWSVTSTIYDHAGRVSRIHRPGVGQPSPAHARRAYDSLGRLLSAAAPDGATTSYEQSMFQTHATDPKGHQSWVRRDRDDRIVDSSNLAGGHQIHTTYCHGEFDELWRVIDGDGHTTQLGYDALGRRTDLSTPDAGSVHHTYNGLGDVLQVDDAVGTTSLHRDVLGRVEWFQNGDGVTMFTWDTAPNGLEKIASTQSPDGTVRSFAYDTVGRTVEEAWTVAGEAFAVATSYDSLGRLDRTRYPAVPGQLRFTTQASYNPAGYLRRVQDVSDVKGPRTLWTVEARNADLALTSSRFGNGVESTRTFDPLTGRITGIDVQAADAFALAYTYDANGNVKTREQADAGRLETFEHDELDRLGVWSLDHTIRGPKGKPIHFAHVTTAYRYDDIGNILAVKVDGQVTETASYGNGVNAHALASHSVLGSFQYDARGRQLEGAGRSVTYTDIDLPRTLTTAGQVTTFEYDASGVRVRKKSPTGTTVSVGGLYERRQQGASAEHVFYVPGERGPVAQVTYDEASQLQKTLYLDGDALGSVQVVLDENGAQVEQDYYDPWGRRVTVDGTAPAPGSNGEVALGFTGHRHDDDLGLIDMKGRIYDPRQRRFLSADDVVPDPLYGQAYNPWSYAYNSPLTYRDPSGHGPCDDSNLIAIDCPPPGGHGGGAMPPGPAEGPRGPRLRPGRAPANAPTPTASDGAGLDDPRQLGDFTVQREGVNGEYSSPEAWRKDHDWAGKAKEVAGGILESALGFLGAVSKLPPQIAVEAIVGMIRGGVQGAKDDGAVGAVAGALNPINPLYQLGVAGADIHMAAERGDARGVAKGATTITLMLGAAIFGGKAANAVGGSTTFLHGTTAAAAEDVLVNGLKAVSANTHRFPPGAVFTHEASAPMAHVAASHWPIVSGKATGMGVRIVALEVPNALLNALRASGLVRTGPVPGVLGFPLETVFLPEAIPALNGGVRFSILPPQF